MLEMISLPENVDKYSVYVGLGLMVWEYVLGNTKLVKSNSTIDLVVSFAKKLFRVGRFK